MKTISFAFASRLSYLLPVAAAAVLIGSGLHRPAHTHGRSTEAHQVVAHVEAVRHVEAARRVGCKAHFPPEDQALGNAGGDPFVFLIFDREKELARLRIAAETCVDAALLESRGQ